MVEVLGETMDGRFVSALTPSLETVGRDGCFAVPSGGEGGAGMEVALRLLIVEDVADDAELEVEALDSQGVMASAVVVVATVREYLDRLEDFHPDVILSDYHLPDLSGEEALRLARQRCPEVPFIMVSGVLGEERAVDLLKQGAWDYVLKDNLTRLGPAVVEATVRARLERERLAALAALAASEEQLRATVESLLDPCVLLAAVRDGSGQIVDFMYTYANDAACQYNGLSLEELVGQQMLDLLPGCAESGLLEMYVRVVETGGALILDGFTYAHELRGGGPRQLDIRAARVGDGVSYTWRDVTDRHAAQEALRESEDRFRSVVVALGEGILMQGADGRIVECNQAAERILGLTREELLGRTASDRRLTAVHEDGSPFPGEAHPAMVALRSGRACRDVVMGVHWEGGSSRWILVNAEPLLRVGKSIPYAVVTSFTDVTELRRAQEELENSEERFRLAFEEALTGMALMDVGPDHLGRYLRVNRALCEFLGYSAQELLGKSYADVTHPDDLAEAQTSLAELMSGQTVGYRAERRYLHASGAVVWGLLSIALVRGRDGAPMYALGQIEDITARKRAEADLVYRALHDDLTGLPNRALLLDHIRGALARSCRGGTRIAVLFLDLDDFKAINDSYGHLVGDEFLKQVGERITRSLRGADTAARIGGDEFVVVCEDLTEPADAGVVAKRIQAALTADIPLRGQVLTAPVSIGIAVSEESSTPETMLRDADSAMYVAKRRGGRRWESADASLHAAAVRVLTIENQLRKALACDQLRVYYQPIYDLRTGGMVAVEALLRWQHPDRGLLLPGEFLDVAEQRGLIGQIGSWVLDTSCTQASTWARRYGQDAPHVAVNVSSHQLGNHGLSNMVHAMLAAAALPPDRLCLEITESQLVSVGTSAVSDLRTLSEAGVRIAVDDFGTGYAGFDYLRRLPVHELKIDTSFVAGLNVDPTDTAITAGVIALGHNLGLPLVAEGIETTDQHQKLRDLGCPWGQGWLWSKALPPEEIDRKLLALGTFES